MCLNIIKKTYNIQQKPPILNINTTNYRLVQLDLFLKFNHLLLFVEYNLIFSFEFLCLFKFLNKDRKCL